MSARRSAHLALLLLAVLLLSACAFQPLQPTGANPQENKADMANPAAVFCEEEGYTYEIRMADDGSQSGTCVFDDGTECDGWAFFRGECKPGGE